MTVNRRNFLRTTTLLPAALATPSILRIESSAYAQDVTTKAVGGPRAIGRKVGEVEVFALMDGYGNFPNAMFSSFEVKTGEAASKLAHKSFDPATSNIGVNAYLIKTKDRVIAVDAGSPSLMGPTAGHWAKALAATGVAPEQIDTMFLTHIHPDHVGGLANPETGARVLPNATLVTSEAEWQFVHDDVIYSKQPKTIQPFWDISRAMVKPYDGVKSFIKPGSEIAPGLTTIALPGHTPGMLGLRIDSGNESLLIWADIIHGTAFQFAQPDWSFVLDADQAKAAETRKSILDMTATDNIMVAGMHLDFPGFGFVERANGAYRFIAAPFDYRG
ncbi:MULTISPECIES: MBL fold metallo-hydrolase [Rhizobium/Agrobacterium group]|uniref:MBL fold metallo-hydrolase n=1 Tax=Rhizobium/Agrobacterium group TaxID=227290 RepID=UPI0015721C1E|nr:MULTISPECIES: MBL fold metallo-hydrolase [Rhizobium/Agrobacterium group]NTC82548.1 MBL fold metallo-hydrolase [Agrobacterium tumefaciens]NTD11371.1 MBL fold metallo-hydrolase [Agrobacterium tumefaciens]NTD88313.1 MBL fold metallo-hydrolase [Agrobacterium tumefaciens]NTD92622.1 MBL fold metallo-hydrolase [Agrobacterium tumefaciens]NTE00951.1 MBL fold metallo-hydrolase [Agrobacterium tumefaciens]